MLGSFECSGEDRAGVWGWSGNGRNPRFLPKEGKDSSQDESGPSLYGCFISLTKMDRETQKKPTV